MYETLESRRLMSVSLNATTGLLTVMGKNDANPMNGDSIAAWTSGTSLKVNDNGAISTFALSKVKSIAVYLRAGDDTVTIDPSVTIPCLLDSGTSTMGGESLRGGSGNDTIIVRGIYSEAYGGAGNDIIQNYGDGNRMYGQSGNDTLSSKRTTTTDSRYEGGTGVDTIDYSSATINMVLRNGQSGEYMLSSGVPIVFGSTFPDGVYGMENFTSGSGNDYVYGTSGNNILKGGGGNDQIRGGDGNDTLYGGTGEDALFGEGGNDVFYSKDSIKDFLSGGLGYDSANRDAIDVINSVEASF